MFIPQTDFYERNLHEVGKELILHCLLWTWDNVRACLPLIKECGYTGVQISPITSSKAQWNDNGRIQPRSSEWYKQLDETWYNLYQPLGFKQIGNHLGTEDDFNYLCDDGMKYGIKIIPDLVTRHTANDEYDCLKPHKDVDPDLLNNPHYWKPSFRINDYNNRDQVIYGCTDLPCLDYDNDELLNNEILPFFRKVSNRTPHFRLDQLKHYATPKEGSQFLVKAFENYPEGLHYGECINVTIDEYRDYAQYMYLLIHEYEFWEGGSKAVRFFQSHDNHRSDLFRIHLSDYERIERWKNLTKTFNMCLLYAHVDDNIIFCDEVKKNNWKVRGL